MNLGQAKKILNKNTVQDIIAPMSRKTGTANIPAKTTPLAEAEIIPQKYRDAYDLGKIAKENGYQGEDAFWKDVFYNNKYSEHPSRPNDNNNWTDAKARFFEAGFYNQDVPGIVRGWRWGGIPESGKSINFRDQKYEKGISLMALEGEKPTGNAMLYQTFNAQGKKKVWVEGYYVGRGADGEPLVIEAKQINKPIKRKDIPNLSRPPVVGGRSTLKSLIPIAAGASLYSPQTALAQKYKKMESDQALQDAYSPVDMVIAGATGGATMGLRAISALADPVINYAIDRMLGD